MGDARDIAKKKKAMEKKGAKGKPAAPAPGKNRSQDRQEIGPGRRGGQSEAEVVTAFLGTTSVSYVIEHNDHNSGVVIS